jgi:hypothetical protein
MPLHVRKFLTVVEEVRSEAALVAVPPLRKVAAVAVIENPLAGSYQESLAELTDASVEIGREMAAAARSAMGAEAPASYGKGAIVGISGEQEHGVAMLTTVFGDVMREHAGGGRAWISSATKRGMPGSSIDVPLAHKNALYVRSHYDAMTITIPDAPLPNEIALICCYANRGRLNARVGGLKADEIAGLDGLT